MAVTLVVARGWSSSCLGENTGTTGDHKGHHSYGETIPNRVLASQLTRFGMASFGRRGNGKIVLCERGIRTFETRTHNSLDLGAVVVARELTNLPILVDPSHA